MMADEVAEGVELLKSMEIAWLADLLGSSISNLGYPVGCGVAPNHETMKRAATKVFERYENIITLAARGHAVRVSP